MKMNRIVVVAPTKMSVATNRQYWIDLERQWISDRVDEFLAAWASPAAMAARHARLADARARARPARKGRTA